MIKPMVFHRFWRWSVRRPGRRFPKHLGRIGPGVELQRLRGVWGDAQAAPQRWEGKLGDGYMGVYSFLYLLYIIYIYIYIYIQLYIYIHISVCGHCPHEGIPSLYICISIYLSIYLSIVWCTMYMYHIRRTSFKYLYTYLWVYIFWIWVPSQGGLWVWFGWLAVPSWIHWDRIIDLRFIYTISCIGAYINEFTYTIGLMWDLRPPVFAVNTLGGGRGDWKF